MESCVCTYLNVRVCVCVCVCVCVTELVVVVFVGFCWLLLLCFCVSVCCVCVCVMCVMWCVCVRTCMEGCVMYVSVMCVYALHVRPLHFGRVQQRPTGAGRRRPSLCACVCVWGGRMDVIRPRLWVRVGFKANLILTLTHAQTLTPSRARAPFARRHGPSGRHSRPRSPQ